MFFFFKQKTAYVMRISDWSSDVCSSDLVISVFPHVVAEDRRALVGHRIHQRVILIGGRGDLELAGIVGDQPRPARTELARALGVEFFLEQIGRASCGERVCKYV